MAAKQIAAMHGIGSVTITDVWKLSEVFL